MAERKIVLEELSEQQLQDYLLQLNAQIKPLTEQREDLQRQVSVLKDQLRQNWTQLGPKELTVEHIKERIRLLNRQKEYEELARSLTQELSSFTERLSGVQNPIINDLYGIMRKVLFDSRFTSVLPKLVEPYIEAYSEKSNGDRIVVDTRGDSCRLMICKSGELGVFYYPKSKLFGKPKATVAVNTLFQNSPPPKGFDSHIFGLSINTKQQTIQIQPVILQNKLIKTYSPSTEALSPVLDNLHEILFAGDISLPKSLENSKIKR